MHLYMSYIYKGHTYKDTHQAYQALVMTGKHIYTIAFLILYLSTKFSTP